MRFVNKYISKVLCYCDNSSNAMVQFASLLKTSGYLYKSTIFPLSFAWYHTHCCICHIAKKLLHQRPMYTHKWLALTRKFAIASLVWETFLLSLPRRGVDRGVWPLISRLASSSYYPSRDRSHNVNVYIHVCCRGRWRSNGKRGHLLFMWVNVFLIFAPVNCISWQDWRACLL